MNSDIRISSENGFFIFNKNRPEFYNGQRGNTKQITGFYMNCDVRKEVIQETLLKKIGKSEENLKQLEFLLNSLKREKKKLIKIQ